MPDERDIYERIVKVVRGLSGEPTAMAAKVLRKDVEDAGFAIVPDEAQALERGKGITLT